MSFDVASVLKKVRLFHSLNENEIKQLEKEMTERRFDPGKCL